jgi:multidrug efflux pump subunit AcrA (membrane-fusion protein)
VNQILDLWHAIRRGSDRAFDAVSAQPIGIVVFAISVGALLYLQVGLAASFRAEAVARAVSIDQPSRIDSFVTQVFVRSGEVVAAGAPLVELSPHFIDRDLARIDARISRQLQEANLGSARLELKEQRWLDPNLRMRPDRPSLESPTEALQAMELAELQTRRAQLIADRAALTIKASHAGRVDLIVVPGAAIGQGTSVASLTPEFAEELVAYLPPNANPASIAIGTTVRIAKPITACRGNATVLRRGARVGEAPGQLLNLFRFPVHGLPVFISIPPDCKLGVGQVLTVEFPRVPAAPVG